MPLPLPRLVSHLALVALLLASTVQRANAQASRPAPSRTQSVIVGAVLGAAIGAGVGYALGSLGKAQPSCTVASSCRERSYGPQGARIGFAIGLPLGAVWGWLRH